MHIYTFWYQFIGSQLFFRLHIAEIIFKRRTWFWIGNWARWRRLFSRKIMRKSTFVIKSRFWGSTQITFALFNLFNTLFIAFDLFDLVFAMSFDCFDWLFTSILTFLCCPICRFSFCYVYSIFVVFFLMFVFLVTSFTFFAVSLFYLIKFHLSILFLDSLWSLTPWTHSTTF